MQTLRCHSHRQASTRLCPVVRRGLPQLSSRRSTFTVGALSDDVQDADDDTRAPEGASTDLKLIATRIGKVRDSTRSCRDPL